jgi:hypothetical protein
MRLKLRPSKHLQAPPAQHRLTVIAGQHRGPEEGEVFRVDIPMELYRDSMGEILMIPDSAWRSYTDGEPVKMDYIEVRVRSLVGRA